MPHYQEHLRFPENHKLLSTPEEVEAEFHGHPELIEEFTRRLQDLKRKTR